MVAAAGEPGTLSPAIGGLCFGGVLLGLLLLAPLTRDDVSLIALTKIELSTQALTERAHTVARNLGHADRPADEAIGYTTDVDYLKYIDEHDRSPDRWRALAAAQPPALLFWYRQSPRPLTPIGGTNMVTPLNPPNTRSGMLSLTLDRAGRLVSLVAAPARTEMPAQESSGASVSSSAIDWTPLFTEAGLPIAQFSPVTPQWIPPIFSNAQAAWEGAYPDRPDVPIRIEAAAAVGKPVYFEIGAPWTRPRNVDRPQGSTSGERVALLMRGVVVPLLEAVAVLLALRNLRSGRGDRRGALRLSLFLLAAGLLSNGLATGDLSALSRGQALVMFVAAFAWVLYVALEPHIRRVWPETMIGWSRLLAGGVRDPLVGRDVLVGVLVAIGDALLVALHHLLRRWSGQPPQFPTGANINPWEGIEATSDLLLGGRHALSRIFGSVLSIPVWGTIMSTFLILFVLYVLLRRRSLAIAAMIVGTDRDIHRLARGLAARQRPGRSLPSVVRRHRIVRGGSDGSRAGGGPVRSAHDPGRVVRQPAVDTAADRHQLAGAVRLVVSSGRGNGDRAGRLWLAYGVGRPPDVRHALPAAASRPPLLIKETSRFPQARIASRSVIVAFRRR